MQIRYKFISRRNRSYLYHVMYLINIFESIQLNGNFKQNFL